MYALSLFTALALSFVTLLCRCCAFSGLNATSGQFNVLARIGSSTTSNDDPVGLVADVRGYVYVCGNTKPSSREQTESDLGVPEKNGLGSEDVFLSRIDKSTGQIYWTLRLGTDREDRVHSIALDPLGNFLYLAGRTYGQIGSNPRTGLSDGFVVKYDVRGENETLPKPVWDEPLVIGTSGADAISTLLVDPNSDAIYATGMTGGKLFDDPHLGNTDAVVLSFNRDSGNVIRGRQFGTALGDLGRAITFGSSEDGSPIFVAAVCERLIGQYKVGNFHLFKFTRALGNLGSFLIKTYADEKVAGLMPHNRFPDTIFVTGFSWLDQYNQNDLFIKRIKQKVNLEDIGVTEMAQDELQIPQYVTRAGSTDGGDDFSVAMKIDSASGKLVVAGNTGGAFSPGAINEAPIGPIIGIFDPNTGLLVGSAQVNLNRKTSWIEINDFYIDANQDYVFLSKRINETTRQFYGVVGTFLVPESWKTRIDPILAVSPTPTPTQVPKPGSGNSEGGETDDQAQGLPIAIIFGAGGGVVVVLITILAVVLTARTRRRAARARINQRRRKKRRRKKRKNEVGRSIRRPPPAAKSISETAARLVTPEDSQGARYSGRLV